MRNHLPSIILVGLETIAAQINGYSAHLSRNLAVAPAVEDPTRVWAERDDVPEDLELGEGLVDLDVVALAVAFYCCCEAAESYFFC
jgi:hypothetical protein